MTADIHMPSGDVAGLTDHPRFPRLGKIRLGIKKQSASGSAYPAATDFFVCPPEVQAIYGEKPRELDILFPVNEANRVAPVAWKKYTATRGKVCTSDGEIAVRIVDTDKLRGVDEPTQDDFDRALADKDTKNWERLEIPCPANDCRFAQEGTCKAVLSLTFLLPKVPGIGVFQLDTGSINSIVDVRGGIELVKRISGGKLAGIPLKLRVEPGTAFPDGKKKTIFTLKLYSPAKLEDVAQFALRSTESIFLPLPEPRVDDLADDLYPAPLTQRTRHVEGVTLAPTGEVIAMPSRKYEAGDPEIEPTSVPITTIGPDTTDELAIAADIEQLFGLLDLDAKQRDLWRNYYKGRAPALRDFLKKQLERRAK